MDYWLGHFHEVNLTPKERLIIGMDKSVAQADANQHSCTEKATTLSLNKCIMTELVENMDANCWFIPWSLYPQEFTPQINNTSVCTDIEEVRLLRKRLRNARNIEKRYS